MWENNRFGGLITVYKNFTCTQLCTRISPSAWVHLQSKRGEGIERGWKQTRNKREGNDKRQECPDRLRPATDRHQPNQPNHRPPTQRYQHHRRRETRQEQQPKSPHSKQIVQGLLRCQCWWCLCERIDYQREGWVETEENEAKESKDATTTNTKTVKINPKGNSQQKTTPQ